MRCSLNFSLVTRRLLWAYSYGHESDKVQKKKKPTTMTSQTFPNGQTQYRLLPLGVHHLLPADVYSSSAQFCNRYRRENTAFIASKGHLPCSPSMYIRIYSKSYNSRLAFDKKTLFGRTQKIVRRRNLHLNSQGFP